MTSFLCSHHTTYKWTTRLKIWPNYHKNVLFIVSRLSNTTIHPTNHISVPIQGPCHTYLISQTLSSAVARTTNFCIFFLFSSSYIKILPFYYIFAFLRKRRFYALKNPVRGMEFTISPFFHPTAQPDTTSTVRSFFLQNVLSYPLIIVVFTCFHFRIRIHLIYWQSPVLSPINCTV